MTKFFERIGRGPGLTVLLLTIGLIGVLTSAPGRFEWWRVLSALVFAMFIGYFLVAAKLGSRAEAGAVRLTEEDRTVIAGVLSADGRISAVKALRVRYPQLSLTAAAELVRTEIE